MSVKITVAKRNSIEEIHRPGCRDLKNRRGFRTSDRDDWTLEIETLRDLYASYWDCIADESVGEGDYPTLEHAWWAWRGEFKLMPCAGEIAEMDEPGSATDEAPKANGTATAKRELGRKVLDAIATEFASASDEDKAKLAYWIRGIPAGKDEAGARYWPANLPRPTTAGW